MDNQLLAQVLGSASAGVATTAHADAESIPPPPVTTGMVPDGTRHPPSFIEVRTDEGTHQSEAAEAMMGVDIPSPKQTSMEAVGTVLQTVSQILITPGTPGSTEVNDPLERIKGLLNQSNALLSQGVRDRNCLLEGPPGG